MNLTIVYVLETGYSAPTVSTAIETVLRDWLNPATWTLGNTLTSVNQIILKIGTVPGVANVTSISGWAPVVGGAVLPSIGTVSITAT